jgi:phosphohistidine phosphatase
MKRVFIIRHAKSSWSFGELSDFERPLNDRGNRDAPVMAERILSKKSEIDLLVTSTAIRARQTCEHFSDTLGINRNDIVLDDALYHASSDMIHAVIRMLDNRFQSVAIFTHNPGVTDFVNGLIDGMRIDNMPTCGVFCVESDISEWNQFEKADKKFKFFDYPKLN